MKAGEHGPDTLYKKFTVFKSKKVLRYDPPFGAHQCLVAKADDEIGKDGEFIFVLRPETNDKAAIAALRTYARVCAATYPGLAAEIEQRVSEVVEKYPDGNPALRKNG